MTFRLETIQHEVRFEVNQIITDRVSSPLVYFFLLVCASILATCGLLLNSPAVIIGAMIIAPFTWPIFRIAYAIAAPNSKLLVSGIKLLVLSILVILCISFLITTILPVYSLTDEVASRISPTIIDLAIALVAGVVAAFALINKKVSQTAAGVAIAASLLSPLCVGGIGLARMRFDVAMGGIFLASVNIIPMVFIASIILVVLMKPVSVDKSLRRNALIVVTVLVIGISIPLFLFFPHFVEQTLHPSLEANVRSVVTNTLPGSFVQTVTIEKNTIDIVLLMPSDKPLSAGIVQHIQTVLTQQVQKNYTLHFHVLTQQQIDVK